MTVIDSRLNVLLIRRAEAPHAGRWALPGGALRIDLDRSLEEGARRVMQERLAVALPFLRQLGAVGGPQRDERAPWALSVIYRAPWYLLLAGLYPRPLAFDWLFWAGAAASGAVLVAAIALLLRREGVPLASGPGRLALAAALIVAVASLKAPGLGPVLSILVIGFANGNRVLAGVGVIALLGYLSHYYYSMQTTLLEKSALLAATGAALLLARLALHRWWPLQPEGARA